MSNSPRATNSASSLYRIYGLIVSSEVSFAQVTPVSEGAALEADVQIAWGEVPSTLPRGRELASWIEVDGSTCLLRFMGVGRFLVEEGRRIIVYKEPEAAHDDLCAFLLGSGLGAVAHQRGLIPLHVSAVSTPLGAIAFTGDSGAGKSTIAAFLNQECRWPLICDDVAAVRFYEDRFYLESGVNTVKLWLDGLHSLNRTSEGLRRDLARHDKFHAIDSDRFVSGKLALARLVLLEWGDEVRLERISGRRAYQVALSAIYRPEFAALFHNRENVALFGMKLASAIEVYVLSRPKDHNHQAVAASHLIASISGAS